MTAALLDGEIWVAGFNGSIDGAALWIQPGREEPTLCVDPCGLHLQWSLGLISHLRDRPAYFSELSDQTRRWIVQHVRPHCDP